MIEFLTADTLCEVLKDRSPALLVRTNWPFLENALDWQGILDLPTSIACAATVAIETGCFAPVKERGGPAYFTKLYENRADLGNVHPGDGALFRGRGFIQITGRSNYQHYGDLLNVDLLKEPELALDPYIAARILALYFKSHRIAEIAALRGWESVRRRVNGGLNGWADFIGIIGKLEKFQPREIKI